MTPGEHIAEAERLLATIGDRGGLPNDPFYSPTVQVGTLHALIAIAVELGAPHAPAAPGGEQGATQAAVG